MIVLGLDVGSVKTGIALLDVPEGALRRSWPSAKATVIRAAWLELDPLLEMVTKLAPRLDLLVIEPPARVFPDTKGGYESSFKRAVNRGNQVAMSREIVGGIKATCRLLKLTPLEVTASEWRRGLLGNASPDDADVERIGGSRILWGPASNNHHRDAAGATLWGAIMQAEKARHAAVLRRAPPEFR